MKKLMVLMVIICINFISCSTKKADSETTSLKGSSLEGKWELNFITGPKIAFDGLYPDNKPTIIFDVQNNKISGNNSCNQYFGVLILDGQKINFTDAKMGMTMMACQGTGDALYMETLKKIQTYTVSENGKTLIFRMGNTEMMRFTHKHKH